MKSLILFSLLCSLWTLNAQAKINGATDSEINAGLQLGLNIANANTSPTLSTDPRVGLMVGGNIEVRLSQFLFIRPEMMYVQKGASMSATGIDTTLKFDYLEFPLLLKARFGAEAFRPVLFAGPSFAFRVNSSMDTKIGSAAPASFTTNAESVDIAIDFGGGAEYWFQKSTAAFLTMRYSLGLTNVLNLAGQTWRSTGLQLIAGFEFGF